jgi:hypothetical protein
MFGFLRNIAMIGTIAWFSPTHDGDPSARIGALRSASGTIVSETMRVGPGLAIEAVGKLDAESRDALATKIVALSLQSTQPSSAVVPKATNSR